VTSRVDQFESHLLLSLLVGGTHYRLQARWGDWPCGVDIQASESARIYCRKHRVANVSGVICATNWIKYLRSKPGGIMVTD
jgi:hypothetical protein